MSSDDPFPLRLSRTRLSFVGGAGLDPANAEADAEVELPQYAELASALLERGVYCGTHRFRGCLVFATLEYLGVTRFHSLSESVTIDQCFKIATARIRVHSRLDTPSRPRSKCNGAPRLERGGGLRALARKNAAPQVPSQVPLSFERSG